MSVRLLVVLCLALLVLCCSYNPQINAIKISSNKSFNQTANSEDNNKFSSPVKAQGTFSNIDGNGVHEWGYSVELWEHDGSLMGVFVGSDGTRLVGDPPTAILSDVMYNSDTGVIAFRASLQGYEYKFEGTLSEKELGGHLFDIRSQLLSQQCDEAKKIVLPKSRELSDEMEEYPTLDAWRERMNEIVRFRMK